MKKKNKLLCLTLTMSLILSTALIPGTAFAEERISGTDNGLEWTFDQDTGALTIKGSGTLEDGAWKDYKDQVKSVKITGKVKKIGWYAFANFKNLTSISMPSTVTEIQYGAFDTCSALKKISLPSSLKSIGQGAFINCKALNQVKVYNGANNTKLTGIGSHAFAGCDALKTLTIPKYVTSIGKYAYGYRLEDGNPFSTKKMSGVKIQGIKKTSAQTYAKNNKITFKTLKDNWKWPKPKIGVPKFTMFAEKLNGNIYNNISISKMDGITGYQVYASFTGKKNSYFKDTTIKAYDTYQNTYTYNVSYGKKRPYFKVRAYVKIGPKYFYGAFSNPKRAV